MDKNDVVALCGLIDQELVRREQTRDVSVLAAGAAFESWLSFEARLLLERDRHLLHADSQGWWTANEYRKVDLGVWEDWNKLHMQVEFKLIHNNKNCFTKADEAWADLFPEPASAKSDLRPGVRASIVVLVGKNYLYKQAYPGQKGDLVAWEKGIWSHLLPTDGPDAGRVNRVWSGTRIPVRDHSLLPDRSDHFVQLHALMPA